jgi:hypothetical protein
MKEKPLKVLKWTAITILFMAVLWIIIGNTIPNPPKLVVITIALSIIVLVVAFIWVALINASRFMRMITKSVQASKSKLGILYIIGGLFIPSFLYPFSSLTGEAENLRFVFMENGLIYEPTFRDLETIFAVPYKYALAFGVIFVFLGVSILAFSYKNQKWGFKEQGKHEGD